MVDILSVLLGIDIGSTNVKCVAVDTDGRFLFSASEPTNVYRVREGMMRAVDGDLLMEAVSRVCRRTMSGVKSRHLSAKILGVATASIGCTALLLDGRDRQIFLPAVTGKVRQAHEVMPAGCFRATGYPEEYENEGYKLVSAAREFPGVLSQVCSVLSIADYVGFRLTGVKLRDFSTAGSMSMLELSENQWWDEFLKTSGLQRDALCQVVQSGTELGEILSDFSAATGIPEGTKIFLGGHDYLCAAFAAGCKGESRLLNVLGTYEMLASFHKRPLCNILREGRRVMIDRHTFPDIFSLTTEVTCGGQLEWLRSFLSTDDGRLSDKKWDRLFSELDSIPPSYENGGGCELFIPRVFGDSFPRVDMNTAAGFLGLRPDTVPAALLRAAIEGVCFLSRDMFDFQQKTTRMADPVIYAVGGGSRNRFWLQTKADILGQRLIVPHIVEATATGAALLAGVGAGVYSGYEEASDLLEKCEKDIYEPNTRRHELLDEIYHEIYLPTLDFLREMDYRLLKFKTK